MQSTIRQAIITMTDRSNGGFAGRRIGNANNPSSQQSYFLSIPLTAPSPRLNSSWYTQEPAIHTPGRPQCPPSRFKIAQPYSIGYLETTITYLLQFHPSIKNLPSSAIQPFESLHLTLGSIRLDQVGLDVILQRLRAINVLAILQQVDLDLGYTEDESMNSITNGLRPLTVTLESLHSFGKPGSSSILYIAPKVGTPQTRRLKAFCDAVRAQCISTGIILPVNRGAILHATVVKTTRVKVGSGGGRKKCPLTFDATQVMEEYEDTIWSPEIPLDRISICKMGARKMSLSEHLGSTPRPPSQQNVSILVDQDVVGGFEMNGTAADNDDGQDRSVVTVYEEIGYVDLPVSGPLLLRVPTPL